MWTTATLLVAGDRDREVLPGVHTFFESHRRFRSWRWIKPGESLCAGKAAEGPWSVDWRNPVTGGESLTVQVQHGGPAATELQVTSVSYPIYDWGMEPPQHPPACSASRRAWAARRDRIGHLQAHSGRTEGLTGYRRSQRDAAVAWYRP